MRVSKTTQLEAVYIRTHARQVAAIYHLCTLRFDILSKLAKVLLSFHIRMLIRKGLFGMVRKISTKQRLQLDPSIVCDL